MYADGQSTRNKKKRAVSANSHYLQTRGKKRLSALCRRSRLVTMVNFSVSAADSYLQTLALQAPNARKMCNAAFLDFEIDITLILDFALIAQITVQYSNLCN